MASRLDEDGCLAPFKRMTCPACQTDLDCHQCHDLRPCIDEYARPYIPHCDWVLSLRTNSCQCCRIILNAVERIQPSVLEDSETFRSREIRIEVQPYGLVYICHRFRRADKWRAQLIAELQLYSPEGRCNRCNTSILR